jgi:hypothetical protein
MAIEKSPGRENKRPRLVRVRKSHGMRCWLQENGLTSSRWRDLLTRRSHSTTVAGTTSRHSESTSAWMEADPNA